MIVIICPLLPITYNHSPKPYITLNLSDRKKAKVFMQQMTNDVDEVKHLLSPNLISFDYDA